jgi:hypothetical protein
MDFMKQDLESLVNQYVESAKAHANEKLRDSHEANRQHAKLVSAFHKLKEFGDPGWKAIRILVSHESPDVRLWAATHLLQVEPQKACEALEQLTQLEGFVGFEAGIVLSEWRAGRLTWA